MPEPVLCCNGTTTSIRFPGMSAAFRAELEAFCNDLQPNHYIVHTGGTPRLPAFPTKQIVGLCCSPSTSVVQVDKSINDITFPSRLFMRDKRIDRGNMAGQPTIIEIRGAAVGFIIKHWDTTPLAEAGPEDGADRLWAGQMWSMACMDCHVQQHKSIKFRCILRQKVASTEAILQELDLYENLLRVLEASNGGGNDGSLTQ